MNFALEHLDLRLQPINRALQHAAEIQAERASQLTEPDRNGLCITENHMRQLFTDIQQDIGDSRFAGTSVRFTDAELSRESHIRNRAREQKITVPIDAMQNSLALTEFQLQCILLCSAAQADSAYDRLFAYIHDDLNRRSPSLELLAGLGSENRYQHFQRRRALAPHAELCSRGLLRISKHTHNELYREYALGDDVLNALTGAPVDWTLHYRDATAVELSDALPLAAFPESDALTRMARALRVSNRCLLGIWGKRNHGLWDAVAALAKAAGRTIHKLDVREPDRDKLTLQASRIGAAGSTLWFDVQDLEDGPDGPDTGLIEDVLIRCACPIILSGRTPWHPLELAATRYLLDAHLAKPSLASREKVWHRVAPDIKAQTARSLSQRYRLSAQEMLAAARTARAETKLRSNGESTAPDATLPAACRSIVQRRSVSFAQLIVPRRKPDDLILPDDLHKRVIEIASLYRHSALVDEEWGFGRIQSGGGGIKVLLTGDSGTGKTAAAEVIAGLLDSGPTLIKVDLASVTSRWVGQTEKRLEKLFVHAEESHCVLFFDEADALFSKRGEVQKGSDRYSNLEVGYLLQRLEDFEGLAILASNHKDQLDSAFLRRFQVVLHFPRPAIAERRQLWNIALPAQAPTDNNIDIGALEHLDLTGSGIVSAARNAALLAADSGADVITMHHLVRAVARQFQHEARLLPASQLGQYAHYLEESA